jgi:N-acetylmuramidase
LKRSETPSRAFVQVAFVFKDALHQPIEGLTVQIKAGAGVPAAPVWVTEPGKTEASPSSRHQGSDAGSLDSVGGRIQAASQGTPPLNSIEATTDKDGYAVTIHNAARNQAIDVLVKNRRGAYAWKGTVVPKKDVSSFTVVSPEYHLSATTQLTPKEEFELDLGLPVIKNNEVMTIDRLLTEFGPYVGWTQKISEQGQVKRYFEKKHEEARPDSRPHVKKSIAAVEHHYKVVNTGKPRTIAFSVLGSRLNYPVRSELTDEHFRYLGDAFECEAAAVKAITYTETGGRGFDENGLPRILFERHYFYRLTLPPEKQATWSVQENPLSIFPDICYRAYGGYGKEGMHQYERLVKAASKDRNAALMSCSWGAFQIMGESYAECGFSSVVEMANRSMESIDYHVKMFESFMKKAKPRAIVALKGKEWGRFATAYNGYNWRAQNPNYANSMAAFYEKFK